MHNDHTITRYRSREGLGTRLPVVQSSLSLSLSLPSLSLSLSPLSPSLSLPSLSWQCWRPQQVFCLWIHSDWEMPSLRSTWSSEEKRSPLHSQCNRSVFLECTHPLYTISLPISRLKTQETQQPCLSMPVSSVGFCRELTSD